MDNNYNNQNDQFNQAPMDPYNGSMPPQGGSKGKAIGSMVTGICSIIPGCCWIWLGLPLAIVALVLGFLSRKNDEDGKGMAIAGIVCGIVGLVVVIINIILLVVLKDSAESLAAWLQEQSKAALFIK
jgi:hypothetical protein